jgi:CMP-2-keto-3-deoxyoctulosonic acid synthetase
LDITEESQEKIQVKVLQEEYGYAMIFTGHPPEIPWLKDLQEWIFNSGIFASGLIS